MSKKERLQARLDYLKALIIAFLVALFGIFGYTAVNYKEIDLVLGICIAIWYSRLIMRNICRK